MHQKKIIGASKIYFHRIEITGFVCRGRRNSAKYRQTNKNITFFSPQKQSSAGKGY